LGIPHFIFSTPAQRCFYLVNVLDEEFYSFNLQ